MLIYKFSEFTLRVLVGNSSVVVVPRHTSHYIALVPSSSELVGTYSSVPPVGTAILFSRNYGAG